MDPGLWFGLQVGLGAALFLAAAKTHGRQIRLERERRGFFEVDFRRDANPPEVEAIWRIDRVAFWRRYATVAVAALLYLFVAGPSGLWLPRSLQGAGAGARLGIAAVALVFWVFPSVFVINTLDSARRLRRDASSWPAAGGPGWARRAWQGTRAWLALDLVLGIAVAVAAAW